MIFKERYEIKDRLGRGGYGEVFKVKDKEDGKFYALKSIAKEPKENEYDFINNWKNEINIMKRIKSEYIVKLKDHFYVESSRSYCIVMELCDTDLSEILKQYKPKGLPLNLIKNIFLQLNEVLKKMLEINYIHRDLKPENILIKYTDNDKLNFDIKLTDFGLSKNINSSKHTYSIAGTKNYCALEIETSHYNNKCDLWSLGVILYELYTNKYIFYSDNLIERENNRIKGKIIKETDNKLINKLIRKLIQIDINNRIEWKKYFEDEFFSIKNGERNGKGKEYYKDGKLKFEGEYLNGKRNGKGKDYNYFGKLEFEGEYLNGERNGKGKEYNDNGKLEFEGEYLNGERNGKGKKYNYYGELEFEGEYLNGKRNGKCKLF